MEQRGNRNQTGRGRGLGWVLGILAGAIAIGSIAAGGAHAATMFTVNLDSSQEVAPGGQLNSPLTGSGTFQLSQNGGNSLSFSIDFDPAIDFADFLGGGSITPTGISPNHVTALHIHNAARGVNGGVVFGILSPSNDLDGDTLINETLSGTTVLGEWDSGEGNGADLDDFIAMLLAAQPGEDVDLYVNLHTFGDAAGLIRGQLVAVPEASTLWLALLGLGALAFLRRP